MSDEERPDRLLALFQQLTEKDDWLRVWLEINEYDAECLGKAALQSVDSECRPTFAYVIGNLLGRMSQASANGRDMIVATQLDFEALRRLVDDLPTLDLCDDAQAQVTLLLRRFERAMIRQRDAEH